MIFKIGHLTKLDKAAGSMLGYGSLIYGDMRVNFRVIQSKDGNVFMSLPSRKGKDNKWYDEVQFISADARKEANAALEDVWTKQDRLPAGLEMFAPIPDLPVDVVQRTL